uniref:Uncharacterized protein n=1 Tax=Eubacterium cellulosolvens (strain ATCC 43171 / JCM 9499 / 6) TaxID=633697 RepID=I5AQ15_EUBC6
MKPYDHLIPATLHEQILAAKADLEDENTSYTELMNSINQFIEDPSIASCGIQSLKRQFEDYLLVINAIITANSFDILEYGILDHQLEEINFEELNGTAVITKVRETVLKKISDELADHYHNLYENSRNPVVNEFYQIIGYSSNEEYLRKAEAYEEESRQHQKMIDICNEIIRKYDNVEAMTSGLFQESVALRAQVTQALQSMGQSFVDGKYKAQLNQNWRATLADPKTQLLCYALLEQADITPEQIANMQEKGYSAQEIFALVRQFPDGADRDFLNALMNKEYENAFKIDPTTLSDGMFDVIAEYSMRMLHYDRDFKYILQNQKSALFEDFTEFEEFQQFNNAILSSTEHYIIPGTKADGIPGIPGRQYGEMYLDKITASSYKLTLCQAIQTANMKTTAGFTEAMEEHYRRLAAYELWATEDIQLRKYRAGVGNNDETIEARISYLNFGITSTIDLETGLLCRSSTAGEISFVMEHMGPHTANDWKKDTMTIYPISTARSMGIQFTVDMLEETRIAYKNANKNAIRNIVLGSTKTALAFIAPHVALTESLIEVFTGSDNGLYGDDGTIQSITRKLTGIKKPLTSFGLSEVCELADNISASLFLKMEIKRKRITFHRSDYSRQI